MPTPRKLSRARLLALAPRSPEQLRVWLRLALDIEIPCERSDPDAGTGPLAYLWHTFHEPAPHEPKKPDAVVWACRSGGKTFYAAVATVLDLVFKPGIEVKALGGSLEQSQRLHAHLRRFFERRPLEHLVDGRMTDRRVRLINTSGAEVLAQSPTSVRGARPQKLRCDEAELFDRDVWAAAQLSPRSKFINGQLIHASIEALSTCHEPFGLMSELIASASAGGSDRTRSVSDGLGEPHSGVDAPAEPEPARLRSGFQAEPRAAKPRRLFRWGVVEILETCEKDRPCEPCALHPECRGTAKRGVGHLRIDDALTMKSRVSTNQWAAEMLCLRPKRDDCVLPEFDEGVHVREALSNHHSPEPVGQASTPVGQASSLPSSPLSWLGGMDFGFRAPSAFLWATHEAATNVLHVIDEHIESRLTIAQHIDRIAKREWPKPQWIGIDPAGNSAEAQSGTSHAIVLRKAGHTVKCRASKIEFGLGLLRARLAPASGTPTLFIHPRCRQLIESLAKYHYPPASTSSLDSAEPVKDGHDHAVDALRYLVLNLDRPLKTQRTCYM